MKLKLKALAASLALAAASGLAAASFNLSADGQLSLTSTALVPEPSGWAMLLVGLLAVGAIARRRMSRRDDA